MFLANKIRCYLISFDFWYPWKVSCSYYSLRLLEPIHQLPKTCWNKNDFDVLLRQAAVNFCLPIAERHRQGHWSMVAKAEGMHFEQMINWNRLNCLSVERFCFLQEHFSCKCELRRWRQTFTSFHFNMSKNSYFEVLNYSLRLTMSVVR